MIQIKPIKQVDTGKFQYKKIPQNFSPERIIWQGVHICVRGNCQESGDEWLIDLPVKHGFITPSAYNISQKQIISHEDIPMQWYTDMLIKIEDSPVKKDVQFTVYGKCSQKNAIILNCVDGWYGHSLLSLMHLNQLLKQKPEDTDIILIIQPFLKWLLPKNIDWGEVWQVNIGLKEAHQFFESFNVQVNERLDRFERVFVSGSPVQPLYPDISLFTGIRPYDFSNPAPFPRITFIWRQDADRQWVRSWFLGKAFKRLKLDNLLLPIHYYRVRSLFKKMKRNKSLQPYKLTLAGLGRFGKFPSYVEDCRVDRFTDDNEHQIANVYAESVVCIGIHGSSMLLPSLFSGMCVSIMPRNRWGNFAQDIFIKPQNPLLEVFERRVIGIDTSISEVAYILHSMVVSRGGYKKMFIDHATQL